MSGHHHASRPFGTLVGVACRVSSVGLGAEIDAHEVGATELVQPVVHAPANAGAVDEHRIGVVAVDLLHDAAGDLHEGRNAELHGRDRARIQTAADADYGLVGAPGGAIHPHGESR